MAADSSPALTKLVPGFEFLQGLVKNAGAAMPNVGQWIAPTLDPAEIDKRIEELRTVQFWLEQNARMLAATIQALEVQRMTLSTLKTMNVAVGDIGQAMKLRAPENAVAASPASSAARAPDTTERAAPAGVVDPMQWWGALTQQFTQLAVQAMKDGSTDAAKKFAGAVAQQSIDAAGRTLKKAASVPTALAQGAVRAVSAPAPCVCVVALRFLQAHAAHADGAQALGRAIAQLRQDAAAHAGFAPTLAFLYLSDHHAAQAEALLDTLRATWPAVSVTGAVGIGVSASGVEYFDEPGVALMLCDLPRAAFTLFNGRAPLARSDAWAALVHADPATHELPALIAELSDRLQSRYLFGGLASSRARTLTLADGVFEGGLSGVAFSPDVVLVSRVTQGCQPIGKPRRVTKAERNLVLELDGEPALALLLRELEVDLGDPARAVAALRRTLVGLTDAGDSALARGGQFGADTRVRHLIGVDPNRNAVAIADAAEVGVQLAFCARDVDAARRDLVRICSEVREEAESSVAVAGNESVPAPRRIAGAIYVSCTGRGGAHFGAPSAELQTVRRALGDVPLVGFYAAGEIARHHLYGYTGVLTAFLD